MTDKNTLQAEIIDLEEYSSKGKIPSHGCWYRVRVNKVHFVFEISHPTREQILEKAGLIPTDGWSLRLKIKGGHRLIKEGEQVDLTEPGIEKFKALSRDQNEG